MLANLFYLICFTVLVAACNNPTPPAQSFYYWKTVFRLTSSERDVLQSGRIDRLYVRYFDVVHDQATGEVRPDATIVFRDSIPAGIEIVPVVFVVNNALAEIPTDSISRMAKRICNRIQKINRTHNIKMPPEMQMDCDWNASTRDRYFGLLAAMRTFLHENQMQLSATLRLHQIKYRRNTGIPPADRVTLMCYNMGQLTEYGSKNSILAPSETEKYMQGAAPYPLPIDIALPIFSWGVCFRNQKYGGLINGLSASDMELPAFAKMADGTYLVDSACFIHGAYLHAGDHIRLEDPSIDEIRHASQIVATHIGKPDRVIWYHLDSTLLHKHPYNELHETVDLLR